MWARWNLDPVLILGLAAVALSYGLLTRRRREDRSSARQGAFYAGWALASLALISPLCALSVSLFSARIGQHMLLETVAAPLMALGLITGNGSSRGSLPAAAGAFSAAMIVWHAPGPYVATFDSTLIYWTMHLTLFGSALWFWREVFSAPPERTVVTVGATLSVSLVMALVGAVILFSPQPLYAPHLLTTAAWGLSPLADQQLGALIMWVPAGLVFVLSVLRAMTVVLMREAPESGSRVTA